MPRKSMPVQVVRPSIMDVTQIVTDTLEEAEWNDTFVALHPSIAQAWQAAEDAREDYEFLADEHDEYCEHLERKNAGRIDDEAKEIFRAAMKAQAIMFKRFDAWNSLVKRLTAMPDSFQSIELWAEFLAGKMRNHVIEQPVPAYYCEAHA